MSDHGYGAYTRGCRCEVCRQAKADYMRARRAAGRSIAVPDTGVCGVLHGTRYAYEERGCRCRLCKQARAYSDYLYRKLGKKRGAA